MNIFLLIKWSHFPLKQTLWRKDCKKSVNCDIIKITQEADFLWEEEKENQWAKEKRTSSECCSRSMVSDITDRLLPQIEDWQKRPLNEVYSIIFIDAVHFSVRCRWETGAEFLASWTSCTPTGWAEPARSVCWNGA